MSKIILYTKPTLTRLEFDRVENLFIMKVSLDVGEKIKKVFISGEDIFLYDSVGIYLRSSKDLSLLATKYFKSIDFMRIYKEFIVIGGEKSIIVLNNTLKEVCRLSLPKIEVNTNNLIIYKDTAYLMESRPSSIYENGVLTSFYPMSIDLSNLPKKLSIIHTPEYKLGVGSTLIKQFLTSPKENWGILAIEILKFHKTGINPTQSIQLWSNQGKPMKKMDIFGWPGRHRYQDTVWYRYQNIFPDSEIHGTREAKARFASFYLVNITSGPPHWAIVVHKEKYIYLVQAHLEDQNITYSHFIYLDTFPPLFPQEVDQVAWVAQKIQLKVLGKYVWVFYKNLRDEDNTYILQVFDSKTYPHPPIQYIVEGDYEENESRNLYDFDIWTDAKENPKADSLWGKLRQKVTSYFSSPKEIKNNCPEAVDLYLKELEEEAKTDTGKIKQLLTSGEKKNIELAFQLCKSLEGNYEAKVGRWLKEWPLLCILYGLEQDYFQGLDRLRLTYRELEKLPPEVMQLTNLEYLDLWGNSFSEEEKERIKKWAEEAGVTLKI